MPSEWKEDAAQRRDTRHRKEGPEETGPIPHKKPSPKKRERLTPLWEVRSHQCRFGDERFVFVSAERQEEAKEKGAAVLGTQDLRIVRLHQKDREQFGDVLDTGTTLTWKEVMERWYPTAHH